MVRPVDKRKPNVVAIYKELHSKGLNIIGVSLDKDKPKWKKRLPKTIEVGSSF
jgi:PHP family Zn ribbon phosphoesterase